MSRLRKRSVTFSLIAIASLFSATLAYGQTAENQIEDEEYVVASVALEHFNSTISQEVGVIAVGENPIGDDRLEGTVNRIRHPEPEGPKEQDAPLTRAIDPARKAEKEKWFKERRKKILEDQTVFAQEIADETILDWTRKGYTKSKFLNSFKTNLRIVVVDPTQWCGPGTSANDPWSVLRTKYPEVDGSLLKVSRVGFNQDRTQAVVEIRYAACPIGGEGFYILLRKKSGVWTVHCLAGAWIS